VAADVLWPRVAAAGPIEPCHGLKEQNCGSDWLYLCRLPVGVKIIGAYMQDKTTIEFARLLAAEMGGFRLPPKFL